MSVYYRSGQTARVWAISPHLVRRLCEARLIDAERTDGGQWKIPHSEVERIKKEGVPEIPSSIEPDDAKYEEECSPAGNSLPMPARGRVVRSAAAAVVANNRRNRLETDDEPEETRNWFPAPQRVEVETWSREHQAQLDKAALGRAEPSKSELIGTIRGWPPRCAPCPGKHRQKLAWLFKRRSLMLLPALGHSTRGR
jgi:hypothetical protein